MLNREEKLLDAAQRREVVKAALRVLGPDFWHRRSTIIQS